jgi:PAS domain S-box-containing protein
MWYNLRKISLKTQLILVFLATFAVMTLYESLKHVVSHYTTLSQSNAITIIFTFFLVIIIGYIPLRALYRQHQKATEEYDRRVAAENLLQQSEEKFQQIFDKVNDGIQIHELSPDGTPGKFIEVNAVACQMLQYTREELLKKGPLDFTTEYHSRPLPEIRQELLTTGHAIFETEHRRKDGTIFPVEINAHVVSLHGVRVTASVVRDITVRKKTGRELQEKEALQRTLLDNLTAGVIIVDAETCTIELVNPAAAAMFGATADQIIGRNCHHFLCPAEVGACPVTDLAQEVDYSERFMLRSDGTKIPILKSVKKIGVGGRVKLLENFIDITERKRMEEALRESEKRYRSVVENANEAIIVAQDGKVKYANPQALKVLGLPEEQVINQPLTAFIHPDDQALVLERHQGRSRGEDVPAHYEFRIVGEKGILAWAQIASVLISWDGKPATLTFLTDITKRKLAEEKNRYFASIIESSDDAIIGKTLDGTITSWNSGAENTYGYAAHEMIGKPINTIVPPERRNELPEILEKLKHGEHLEHYETVRIRKDGKPIQISLTISPIFDDAGSVIGASTIARDISEQKKIQDALILANKKLNLLSSVTRHDILNQLMGLRTFLELSKEDTKDPVLLEYIRKEDQAAEAIQWQIEFSRSYQELGTQAPQWQDVAECIDAAKQELNLGEVKLDVAVSGIEVFADAPFEKVFFNLMDNSLRHGEHVTKIEFSANETDHSLVLFYRDNGVGIPSEDKKKLFKRGFGKQIGLGMFLSREILAITNITITETGEPGKGVQFEISVPKGTYRFSGAI